MVSRQRWPVHGALSFVFQDVFIFDNGQAVFVWIGANASPDEKKNGLPLAHVCSHLWSFIPLSLLSLCDGEFQRTYLLGR